MENVKISDMSIKTPNNLEDLTTANKYYVPALIPNDPENKNGRLDIGNMFLLFQRKIDELVEQAINQKIEEGIIGGAVVDDEESQGGGQSSGASSAEIEQLNRKINSLSTEIDNFKQASNWPKHFIQLVDGQGYTSLYVINTGYQETSNNSEQNPIVIQQLSIDLPNFFVQLQISAPSYDSATNKVKASVTYNIYITQDQITLKGGRVGTLVISGGFSTPQGSFTFQDYSLEINTVLGTQQDQVTETQAQTVILESQSTFNADPSVTQASVTCSVQGVALNQQATYSSTGSGSGSATVVTGQIKLPTNNAS